MTTRRQLLVRQERAREVAYDWIVVCPTNERLVTCVSTPMQPQYCPVCGQPSKAVWRPRGKRA